MSHRLGAVFSKVARSFGEGCRVRKRVRKAVRGLAGAFCCFVVAFLEVIECGAGRF
jgi:hypothetical protein